MNPERKSIPEPVAGAADRLDACAGRAQLAPDLQDVLVERTACGEVVLSPYGVEKRIVGEDLPRVRREGPEKPKLSYGQGLLRLTGYADKKAARVYKRVAYAECVLGTGRMRRDVGPAKRRRDAGEKFPHPERLGNEVVRSQSQSDAQSMSTVPAICT